jgi:hypothetical protein
MTNETVVQDFVRRIAMTPEGSKEAEAIFAEVCSAGLAEEVAAELRRHSTALKREWCERNGVPDFPTVQ